MVLECVTNFVRIYQGSLVRAVGRWAEDAGYVFRIKRRSLSLWVPQVRERVVLIFLRGDFPDFPPSRLRTRCLGT
jgi:site-specific DNA-cytosine methylase